jgi:hypothetical protein
MLLVGLLIERHDENDENVYARWIRNAYDRLRRSYSMHKFLGESFPGESARENVMSSENSCTSFFMLV